MTDPNKDLAYTLDDFARGALFMWLRGLPPRLARNVDPQVIHASIAHICDQAVANTLQRHGNKRAPIEADEVRMIQSQLLDDMATTLSYIFFGEAAAA